MSLRRGKRDGGPPSSTIYYVTCACGKRGYASRRDARRARREVDPAMRIYVCRAGGEALHVGHVTWPGRERHA